MCVAPSQRLQLVDYSENVAWTMYEKFTGQLVFDEVILETIPANMVHL